MKEGLKMEKIQNEQNQEMKNTVSKKSEKVKEVEKMESTEKNFKELSEMTPEEITSLGKVSAIIRKVYYKKSKRTGYEIEVKLHEYLTIKNSLSQSEYFIFMLQLNLDQKFSEHTLRIPCRFVTGINKNGNQYHQLELYFTKDVYYGNLWLNGPDLKLFNMVLPNINFMERNSVLDIDTQNQYYQE